MCQYYVKLLVLFYNSKFFRPYSTLSFVLLPMFKQHSDIFSKNKNQLINFTFKVLTSVVLFNSSAPDSDLAVMFLTTESTL